MPELPEVETVRSGLSREIVDDVVDSVIVMRADSIAHPTAKQFSKKLKNCKVKKVLRRGKYLIIEFENMSSLVVHLRMSGRLIVKKTRESEDRFLRVKILLKSGVELHFEDMRVFGRMWYVTKSEKVDSVVSGIAKLGVEPLEGLTDFYLQEKFKNKKQPIKSALLDQRIIAGIGNIYADESLFLCGIHPATQAGKIKKKKLKELVETVQKVLSDAIKHGGSTLKDYRQADGINGNYQNHAWVYGRSKSSCRICQSEIGRIKLAGRSTHFCPKCQKKTR